MKEGLNTAQNTGFPARKAGSLGQISSRSKDMPAATIDRVERSQGKAVLERTSINRRRCSRAAKLILGKTKGRFGDTKHELGVLPHSFRVAHARS
jgi:hypothetical protein